MTTHLSARLTWHDSGWNGTVCRDPRANVYCTVHDHIRDRKDDELQQQYAGQRLADIGFRPPCSRDPAAWSPTGYQIEHDDPLEWRGLGSIVEDLPPYSVATSPYRHMFADGGGWEYDRDKQMEKLAAFWGELEPSRSLVFYYLKDGQPFVETSQRIVCGIGRIARFGPQTSSRGAIKARITIRSGAGPSSRTSRPKASAFRCRSISRSGSRSRRSCPSSRSFQTGWSRRSPMWPSM